MNDQDTIVEKVLPLRKQSGFTVLGSALLVLLGFSLSWAQDGTVGDTDIEIFNISGNVSNEAHGYTTTRDVNRKAPVGNVTTANVNFSVLGFDSGVNFRYDTDDSDFRQSVNRIGFSGSWRWIALSAGDVSPSWGSYSLSGTRIRGGHVELTPGSLILEVTGGRANRAIGPDDDEQLRRVSFERMLYGARVGVGNTSASFFTISGFYAKDDPESITLPEDMDDSDLFSGRNASPPAENLLISPELQLSLFDRSFQFGVQGSASALTRDLRSQRIDVQEIGVPEFVTDVMEIRSSTRLGLAGSAFTRLNVDPVDLQLNYERYQPGFESLGLRSVRDDQQSYSAELGMDLFDRRLRLTNRFGINEDNLAGNRTQTQTGMDYSVDATTQLGQNITLSTGYSITTTSSEPENQQAQTTSSNHVNQNFQLQPTLNVMRGDNTHTVTLSTFYQTNRSEIVTQQDQRITEGYTLNTSVSYSLSLFGGLSFNSSVNGLIGDSGASDITNFGLNTGVGYSFFDGEVSTNLNLGFSRNQVSRQGQGEQPGMDSVTGQFNGSGTLSWQITDSGSLRFNVRTNSNTIQEGQGNEFSEFESRLAFNYNF